MFTKEDYRQYFEEIALTERAMVYQLEDVINSIEDTDIIKPLETIGMDEIRHYGLMMQLFDNILLKNEMEKRQFQREHALGKVMIKDLADNRTIEAYCINVSSRGLCLEFQESLNKDHTYAIRVDFYDGREPMECEGCIKWSVQINPAFHMAGVFFRAGIGF